MKLFFTFLISFFSITTFGQSIEFRLTGAYERKWVGEKTYSDEPTENRITLVINKNHTYYIAGKKPNAQQKPLTWSIEQGAYANGTIVIRLDKTRYHLEFLKASNGLDMITLTNIPADEDEPLVIKTFVNG